MAFQLSRRHVDALLYYPGGESASFAQLQWTLTVGCSQLPHSDVQQRVASWSHCLCMKLERCTRRYRALNCSGRLSRAENRLSAAQVQSSTRTQRAACEHNNASLFVQVCLQYTSSRGQRSSLCFVLTKVQSGMPLLCRSCVAVGRSIIPRSTRRDKERIARLYHGITRSSNRGEHALIRPKCDTLVNGGRLRQFEHDSSGTAASCDNDIWKLAISSISGAVCERQRK